MSCSPSLAFPGSADFRPGLAALGPACAAVTLPTLIAHNLPPSTTFFNQAAAFVGWVQWAVTGRGMVGAWRDC